MNILQAKKYYLLIEAITFIRKSVGKKNKKKQVYAFKSLNISDKPDELKQTESIFPQNQLNDLICDRLKKSVNYRMVSN